MRKALVALSLGAFVIGAFAPMSDASAAGPKLSKFGCVVGKQRWDASMGKCVDGRPVTKMKAKSAPKAAKPAPKKAMVKKAPKKAPEKKAS